MTSRLSPYGIGAIYGRKPFWLTGGLTEWSHFGYGGCPELRNLGCGGDGGLAQMLRDREHALHDDGSPLRVP